MTSTYSANKHYQLQGTGDNPNAWGTILNNNVFSIVDANLGGRLAISVAGSSNVTLSQTQADNLHHTLSGILTGNIDYIFPNQGGFFLLKNTATGSFSITAKPTGGSGLVLPTTGTTPVFIDPTAGNAVAMFDSLPKLSVYGSSAPANGIYLPSANNFGISANSALQFQVQGTASAVNYIQVAGGATGAPGVVTMSAQGSDTNVQFSYYSKGTGAHKFYTGGGSQLELEITHTASAVNYFSMTGGATGSPGLVTLSAAGSDSNISIRLTPKGSGAIIANKAINEAAYVVVASATTTDIGAAASNNVNVTGTTTITGFGTSDEGVTRRVFFSGALTLTHSANLSLPTAANITTVAGDTLLATSSGAGVWVVTRYQRKDGTSVAYKTPTVQTFTSGSGTYTTPANVKHIIVELVGGGGGGAGSGSGAGNGSAGSATTFGSAFLTGGAGGAGSASNAAAVSGGTGTGGDINIQGGSSIGANGATSITAPTGGISYFGGAGPGGGPSVAGQLAAANTGSGGGAGGGTSPNTGGAGSAGGYVRKLIGAPSATYAYSVGAGGGAGTAGTGGTAGGAGAAGIITVTEFYE